MTQNNVTFWTDFAAADLALPDLALAVSLSLALSAAALMLVARHRWQGRPAQTHEGAPRARAAPPDREGTAPLATDPPSDRISDRLTARLAHLPIPAWTLADDGTIDGGNPAFARLADRLLADPDSLAPLRRPAEGAKAPEGQSTLGYRAHLPAAGRRAEVWLDISARRNGAGGWDCAAQDVTALVVAEQAQRDFVQTLTKTFAQLSTGLAIFDRARQLILFNPALLDLTRLSPEFLASRPALAHFFDHLRDHQIMPEPKSYASWRDHLTALVSAATDGRLQETWSLPGGATYRVTGRPHPNGAVAFLFEDISDQIAMTRRFRQQLSLSQSVLDAFTDGIVIFANDGTLSYCNSAYRALFALPEGAELAGLGVDDALRLWSDRAEAPEALTPIRQQLARPRGGDGQRHPLMLRGAGPAVCTVIPLAGGARMVSFGSATPRGDGGPRAPAELRLNRA
ncbi:PAS-domain containing protein [Pseudooceanicola sp. 200-1SW]|uniref:PAS-domain containing protein n=1 Tax=Pseudooceanicola sp. 200-1SW TaxID=3425949 RepID=UPI003D7F8EF1